MKLKYCTIDNIEDKLKENERNGFILVDLYGVNSHYFITHDNEYVEIIRLINERYENKAFFINVVPMIRNYLNTVL